MTPHTLQPLLQQWSEIEPGRCELDEPRWWVYYVFLDEARYFVNAQNPEPEQLRWLEFAIREAAAVGRQKILIQQLDIRPPLWIGGIGRSVAADESPVIALLKAYLKSLAAEEVA